MIPIFKSHYSIGKSILTLNPAGNKDSSQSDSIFDILIDNKIDTLVLVDDSPTGFLQARKYCSEYNINFIFGLRLSFLCEQDEDSLHKNIVFSKSSNGCKILNEIYSQSFSIESKHCSYEILKGLWSKDDLMLAVPFYDSFLYQNTFSFSNCVPDFSFCDPVFMIENNNLPTDNLMIPVIEKYCSDFNYSTLPCQTILYKNAEDVEALQTYKCICNRNFGKSRTLDKPNFHNFGSNEFSFESFLSKSKSKY